MLHNTLRVQLSTIFALIVALAVLHNIAISRNDPDFEPEGNKGNNDGFGDEDDDNEQEDGDDNHNTLPYLCIFTSF